MRQSVPRRALSLMFTTTSCPFPTPAASRRRWLGTGTSLRGSIPSSNARGRVSTLLFFFFLRARRFCIFSFLDASHMSLWRRLCSPVCSGRAFAALLLAVRSGAGRAGPCVSWSAPLRLLSAVPASHAAVGPSALVAVADGSEGESTFLCIDTHTLSLPPSLCVCVVDVGGCFVDVGVGASWMCVWVWGGVVAH